MLRYDRQTKPGLVALYDIRPGNRAGPFLQPRSRTGLTVQKERLRIIVFGGSGGLFVFRNMLVSLLCLLVLARCVGTSYVHRHLI